MAKPLGSLVIGVLITGLMIAPNLPGEAGASALYVSTTGNDSSDCLSPESACRTIQAAVDKAANGDAIHLAAGVYAGSIDIIEREKLTILGTAGAAIADPGLPFGSTVVTVLLSKNIRFQDLTFSGNPDGVEALRIFDSIGIVVERSTIEQANIGFFLNNSGVTISDCMIRDNGIGIRVDAGSSASLNSAPFSTGTSTVQGNVTGVLVRTGSFGLLGATIIQNNNVGISAHGGVIKSCCQDGLRRISNNDTGILLRGDNLDLRGPLQMEGNRSYAIRMFGGFASVSDRVVIRGNGTTGTAGIFVTGGRLHLEGRQPNDVQVSSNPGNGVTLTDNASARLANTLIRNNGGHGVRVQALSVAELFGTAMIRRNKGFDFSCTPNSLGRGDRSGVLRMSCPGFEPEPPLPAPKAAEPPPGAPTVSEQRRPRH